MNLSFRQATEADLPALVQLLADDVLGKNREDATLPLRPEYLAAFAAIAADTNQFMLLAIHAEQVVGCVQISFIPGLTRLGMWRGQLEGVRVAAALRDAGVGQQLIAQALVIFREKGCGLVQLTTDKTRTEAQRFYEKFGFVATHEGMKLAL